MPDMVTLPQLLEADIQQIDAALRDLLRLGEATTALLTDEAGFLITHQGDDQRFDLTTMAALASGAFMANQSIANLIREENFSSTYQAGEHFSLFVTGVDAQCLLVVIFQARNSVGAVKYHAAEAVSRIATQLRLARERNPAGGIDLPAMNLVDSSSLFKGGI
jgi:predicted regulator of Ras-like GTPase activity (Roadblock/LC7/MglB family)